MRYTYDYKKHIKQNKDIANNIYKMKEIQTKANVIESVTGKSMNKYRSKLKGGRNTIISRNIIESITGLITSSLLILKNMFYNK